MRKNSPEVTAKKMEIALALMKEWGPSDKGPHPSLNKLLDAFGEAYRGVGRVVDGDDLDGGQANQR